ncbi:hypothetical protein [Aureimonas populi]|uniref:Uncharacterized protein n=1 Tax=Aureimonas populi TaxID=1701758 RepID=A0ABW5CIU0_9HYPH|nr:hypothetical protein [Aureimonas populi]
MATCAHTTTLSASAIMKAAWASYRDLFGSQRFDRKAFSNCLWAAWNEAKADVETAARIAEAKAANTARRAADPVAAAIEDQIASLAYLPAHMSVQRRVAELRRSAA